MRRQNCWDFNKCGREPEGSNVIGFGECPAAIVDFADGYNGGIKGGRICWAVAGTLSGSKVRGINTGNVFSCINCAFFKLVEKEEGIHNFELLTPVRMNQYKLISRNRRKHMRFDIHFDMDVFPDQGPADRLPAVTRNYSRDGLSFISETFSSTLKDILNLQIRHPRIKSSVTTAGNIIWKIKVRDRIMVGLQFTDTEIAHRNNLLDHVYDRWIDEAVYFQS